MKQHVRDIIDALVPYAFWYVVLVTLWNVSPLARDDSDQGSWGVRSGVSVRTDALTGCQYLEGSRGGMVQRVDAAGRHVGCKAVK